MPTFDDDARPTTSAYDRADDLSRAHGDHLRMIHDMYRDGLSRAAGVIAQVVEGTSVVSDARSAIHAVGLEAAYEQLGSFCGQLCRGIEVHHRIEDAHVYPALRSADGQMSPVLDQLGGEHEVVHEMLLRLDRTLVRLIEDGADADPGRLETLEQEFTHLCGLLESHFCYEEQQLGAALGVHRIAI